MLALGAQGPSPSKGVGKSTLSFSHFVGLTLRPYVLPKRWPHHLFSLLPVRHFLLDYPAGILMSIDGNVALLPGKSSFGFNELRGGGFIRIRQPASNLLL